MKKSKFNDVDYLKIGTLDKNTPSKKLSKLIEEVRARDYEVGETISVQRKAFESHVCRSESINAKILFIDGDKVTIQRYSKTAVIDKSDIEGKSIFNIGANPFAPSDGIRPVAYQLSSILYSTGILIYKSEAVRELYSVPNAQGELIEIMTCCFNPFVYTNGEKQYYQRDFVWTKRDCQNLIESIYQRIDCGKILIRNRGWAELKEMALNGETELSFKDVVDGKQRLTAIAKFINNEYPDLQGNYFGDLSSEAKYNLYEHQLISYAEMGEKTTDKEVLHQFLKMNHLGVPQSKEHIDFVKSLYNKK